MNSQEFNRAFAEQNRRDQIAYSTLATVLSMILNLACSIMDHLVYPTVAERFLYVRLGSIAVVALAWIWFVRTGKKHHRVFGVMWYASPLAIILWMIYYANIHFPNTQAPYYAGLNIVLLAVGVLSPWTYVQNLISAGLVLACYVLVCFLPGAGQDWAVFTNNTTFLVLTAVIVVASSRANSRQRLREFSLRWELDESRRAVEQNNQRLVELDEAKSRFFANISHELRTPLTLLIAPLETLMHRHQAQLNPESLSLLQTMHGNSLRLLKLINDLLNIVRLESGKLQVKREPVVMVDFVKGLVSAARQMADDKRIQLETDVALQVGAVMVDRDKVEKTLLNLVFNALKFTPTGGRVSIQVVRAENDLVISVHDTGVGIPKEKLAQVFTRFWQADDSSSRRYQGVGIGLSLVKEFTELQGGSVAVVSEAGKGSTFTVRLPYIEVTAEEAAHAATITHETGGDANIANASSSEWLTNLYRRAEQSPAGITARALPTLKGPGNADLPRVLVADDEPDMLHFMASQLTEHYQVIQAVDGVQAVEKAIATPPDLILTDMMMPGKDGLEVCKDIRAHPATKGIPIVMITARADEETKLAVLNAGANDFLPKPFSTTELHVRVKNLVDSHRFQRGLETQNIALESALAQLKQMQDQLITKEKLASLGVWSAGIIHEMNNPLNFARTGLYSLRNKDKLLPTEEREDFREVMHDIEDGIDRVHKIVSELRTYAHPGKGECEEVLLTDVVRMVLRFFSVYLHGYAEVIQQIPPDLTVFVNRNKLIQVINNLLQNSVDALKTKDFGADHPTITIEAHEENGRCKLILRDNGPGIEQQNLDKIFDPFFTTKDVGKGMGLGLGICYRIVQEFGGNITVRSQPGQFCEFTLDFPAQRSEPAQVATE